MDGPTGGRVYGGMVRGAKKKGASLFWRTSKLRSQRVRRCDREESQGIGERDGERTRPPLLVASKWWLARSLARSRVFVTLIRFLRLCLVSFGTSHGARWPTRSPPSLSYLCHGLSNPWSSMRGRDHRAVDVNGTIPR